MLTRGEVFHTGVIEQSNNEEEIEVCLNFDVLDPRRHFAGIDSSGDIAGEESSVEGHGDRVMD